MCLTPTNAALKSGSPHGYLRFCSDLDLPGAPRHRHHCVRKNLYRDASWPITGLLALISQDKLPRRRAAAFWRDPAPQKPLPRGGGAAFGSFVGPRTLPTPQRGPRSGNRLLALPRSRASRRPMGEPLSRRAGALQWAAPLLACGLGKPHPVRVAVGRRERREAELEPAAEAASSGERLQRPLLSRSLLPPLLICPRVSAATWGARGAPLVTVRGEVGGGRSREGFSAGRRR